VNSFPNVRADRRTLDVIQGQPPDLLTPPPGCRFADRCEFVMPVCREVVPPEVRFSDGVRVACHLFPTSDMPGVEPQPTVTSAPTATA
jgi:oligopeptide/dipeptide ABC transporter ATP-binding protein